ncbi:MAG: histidine kinase dimerization/phospho-acceptor domain-containing protein [Alphaproteobacteria bacterium]
MDATPLDPGTLRLVPPAAARTIARVAGTALPILCLDCFGPAFERLAAAIHGASRRDRLVRVDLHEAREGLLAGLIRAATSPRCTLSIDGIDRLDDDAQGALLRLVDGDGPRLVSASLEDLATLRSRLRPELFALLTTITVRTPALARAGSEIGEIARARLVALAGELGQEPPALDASAIRALADHDWPGDAAELDAVLARTLLDHDDGPVSAADLCWAPLGSADAPGEVGPGSGLPSPAAGTARGEPATGVGSEAIAVELAHRIKNPLVTVRTFVQSVAQLAADPADLARFRDLTEEAIGRMDDALEDILAFSRLAPPAPDAIEVLGLLREALREAMGPRAADADAIDLPDDARLVASADEPRLRAALAAIARHVQETIEPAGRLSDDVDGDALVLRHPEAGATSHLRGVTGLDEDLPLPLLLARGALATGGASLEARDENGLRRIELRFPGAEGIRPSRRGGTSAGRDGLRRDA